MGSLKYEITQKCKEIKLAETQKKTQKAADQSWKLYMDHAVKYGMWCKSHYQCRHLDDCRAYIQDYADWLVTQGKSASTIHTYLAGVCRVFEVPLRNINKPRRIVAENTRSRGTKAVDYRSDSIRDASPRLYDLATMVGCRRAEYAHLRCNDLVYDESGYLCVRIKRGKGGKYQEQRVLPENELFIRQYFDGSNNYVFTKKEMENKIDLHHLRSQLAQRQYQYYANRLKQEPEYRAQLDAEIKARWCRHNKRSWKQRDFEGYYCLRGNNKQLAIKKGLPLRYDRLAVMAVSVFHLSHWRNDVTISNYLLAV